MSILIKGMDMPKEGLYELSFAQSGGVTICLIEESYPDGGGRLVEHKGVVEVPTPHGRLVDIDTEVEKHKGVPILGEHLKLMSKHMATVIESEE